LDKQLQTNSEQKDAGQQALKDIISSREDGFGFILKSARTGKNLSISEVARDLRLDEKFILAIEGEDYTQLPVPAFVCGYIRNYAKLMGLQPEALIADYKKGSKNEDMEPELKISKQKKLTKSSTNSIVFKLIIKLLLLVIFVFGSWKLWLYVSDNFLEAEITSGRDKPLIDNADPIMDFSLNEQQNNDDELSLPVIDESKPAGMIEATKKIEMTNNVSLAVENSLAADGSLSVEDSSSVEGDLSAEDSILAEGSASTGDSIDSDTSSQINGSMTESSLPISSSSVKISSSDDGSAEKILIENTASEMTTVDDAENNSVQSTDDSIASTSGLLILEFSVDSWIKIVDANNKTLSSGTKKAGETLRIKGELPYNVLIGNADKVKVTFNNQLFDQSEYINENSIARYSLE